jgi:hypothetical protein
VAKADVLARIKQDLALGHTHTATQRLRTLVTVHPDDPELREMLANVYRQTGNLSESGRWAFLGDDLSSAEQAAFERANPDPALRLRLLRWSGDETVLPSEAARERLRALVAAAERSGPPTVRQGPWAGAPSRSGFGRSPAVPCLFVLLTLAGLGSLVAIGFLRALNWIIG